ncbi:netrin-1-like isoform X1 [Watersipora subatra]|uniref:netrin-1-like isoform X1 n=1 Tax=Watersipora subatra TaxID=2589382 RepID=UPI00355AE9D8
MAKLLLLFLACLSLTAMARKRSDDYRDAPSLSYQKSREFSAAYRRAAVLANNNVIPTDSCYGADGKAKKCVVSEFGNIALEKEVEATSTCGMPPNRYCNRTPSLMGGEMRQCYICDANHKDRMNPASYLIDSNQKTCWVSQTFNDSSAANEAVITISLQKKYELTYITLPFCNKLPESLALYKSADFGRKWVPLQYFSSECMNMYGLEENGIILKSNEQAAVCKNIYSSSNSYTNKRIAFSLVEGRPSAHDLENSPVLRDWVTVTDIKVVLNRLSSPNELATGLDDNYYSLAEITLGGRCKCNGHGSKCVTDSLGQTKCECQHNTAGDDCDRCKDFYFDRPWKLATNEDANECIACQCNLHSKKCVFSNDLYMLSGKLSGGVCIKCRHNTAGNKCHYCKEGYYRDYTKPLSHRKVCKDCKCHPYGSRERSCSEDGQCNCKEGVTGQKCDRCKSGFTMTKEIISPCQSDSQHSPERKDGDKIPRNLVKENTSPDRDNRQTDKAPQECGSCRSLANKLDVRKYCNSEFAIKATVQKREAIDRGWIRFAVLVQYVYKKSPESSSRRVRRDTKYVYVLESDLHCKCPKLRINKTYIMIGAKNEMSEQDGLTLDRDSIVVRYNSDYDKRVKFYKKEERRQACRAYL